VEFYLNSRARLHGLQVTWKKKSRQSKDLIQHSGPKGREAAPLGDLRRFERKRRLHLREFKVSS